MSTDQIKSIVSRITGLMVAGDYEGVVRLCKRSRLQGAAMATTVQEYGRTLAELPPQSLDRLDVVAVKEAAMPTYSVRVPLWTKEEGQSDLTMELTITIEANGAIVELDDLRVL